VLSVLFFCCQNRFHLHGSDTTTTNLDIRTLYGNEQLGLEGEIHPA
jgi:hypothetical protein